MDPLARTRWNEFRDNPCEATFVPLYEATRRLVYTLCFRILRDEDDALDAFQAVYCRLLEAARRREAGGQSPEDFHVAVGRLAIREADNLRKRRGRRARREVAMDPLPEPSTSAPGADALAERSLLRARIETFIDTLPERHRLVLHLHYFDGLSKAQIAGMLGKPASTVTRRLEAGVGRLRPLLQRAGIVDVGSALGGLIAVAALLDPPAKAMAASAAYHAAAGVLASGGTAAAATSVSGAVLSSGVVKTGVAASPAIIGAGVVGAGVLVAVLWMALVPRSPVPPASPGPSGGAAPLAVAGAPTTAVPPANPGTVAQDEELAENAETVTDEADAKSNDAVGDIRFALHVYWEDTKRPVAETTVTLTQVSTETDAEAGNTEALSPSKAATAAPRPFFTQTDAGGDAEFLVPSGWPGAMLEVLHPQAIEAERLVTIPSASSPFEVAVRRGATVFGHAWIEGEGRPAAGAKVEADPGGKSARVAADGSYEIVGLASKEVRLLATIGIYRSAPNNGTREQVDLVQGKRNGPHDLVLRPGAVLTGRIVDDATGEPLDDASVVLSPLYHINNMYRETVSVGSDGRYRAEGLAADSIPLAAEAPGHATSYTWIDVRAEEPTVCNFRLEGGFPLDFQVVDPQGKPIPGVEFRWQIGGVYYKTEQSTDGEGRARFEAVSPSAPPEFSVEKAGYTHNERLIPTLDSSRRAFKPIHVIMRPVVVSTVPGVFVGKVTDEKDLPIPGAIVQWSAEYDGEARNGANTETDAEGRYRLSIPPGTEGTLLAARAEGHAPTWEKNVPPGSPDSPKKIDLVLAPGHWIAGTVVDPEGNPLSDISVYPLPDDPKFAFPVVGYSWNYRTDAEGRFRFENIPGPKVIVRASRKGCSSLRKKVEVDREVQLVLQPIGAIHGRVIDADTGDPVREFTLRASGPGIDASRTMLGQKFSDLNGEFLLKDLDSGDGYTITVKAEGFQPAVVRDLKAMPTDDKSEAVEIPLERGETVQVQLVDSVTKEPVGGGEAVVALYREGYSFDWNQLNEGNAALQAVRHIRIGPDGSFSFLESHEKYTLFLLPAGHTHAKILPGDRGPFKDPEGRLKIPVDRGASVEGTVAVGGVPVSAVRVLAYARDNRAFQALKGPVNTFTDADGRFHFEGLPASEYNAQVYRSPGASWIIFDFALAPGDQKSIDVAAALGLHTLRGRVLDGDTPVENVTVSLNPKFTSLINSFRSTTARDGDFDIPGLPPGDYRVSLSISSENRFYSVPLEESLRIDGDTTHDFQLARPNLILGRLRFPEELDAAERKKFIVVRIERKATSLLEMFKRSKGQPDLDGRAEIENGTFSIRGRFQGEYTISLTYQPKGGQASVLRIDPALQLDNLQGDQDIGSLAVPDFGSVRLRAVFEPKPEGKPVNFAVGLMRSGDKQPAARFSLNSDAEVHTLSPVPPGQYTLKLIAPGFQMDRKEVPVEVTFGTTAEVAVVLRPVGMVAGMVMDAGDQANFLAIRSATLTAEDGTVLTARVLDASVPFDKYSLLENGEAIAVQMAFYFPSLAGGTYQLAIEVDGFETYHETVTVVPGAFEEPKPIPMKRKGTTP